MDIISRMLDHNPLKRISFEDLFVHPFVSRKISIEDYEILQCNSSSGESIIASEGGPMSMSP
jgi:serine/threonine protein kinase